MKDLDLMNKIGRETLIIVIGFSVGTVFQYLYRMFIARFLGPEALGIFTQGLVLANICAVLAIFGLNMAIPRFMSYYESETTKINKIISLGFFVVIFSSTILSVILNLSSEFISADLLNEPALQTIINTFSFAVIPLAVVFYIISLFRGKQDAKTKIIFDDLIWSGLLFFIASIVILYGYQINKIVYAYVFATSISAIIGVYIYLNKFTFSIEKEDLPIKKIAYFTWPLFLLSIFSFMNDRVDILILGSFVSSSKVGIYEVAFSIANYVDLALISMNFIFMPIVSELYGDRNMVKIRDLFTKCTRWLTIVTFPLYAGILIFPEEIINILFGFNYISGSYALIILSTAFFYKVLTGPTGVLLLSIGETKKMMIAAGITTSSIVFFNFLLVPIYGLIGSAFSTFISLLVGQTILLKMASDKIGDLPVSKKQLKVLPPIVCSSGIIYLFKIVFNPGLVLSFVLGIVLVLLYGYLLVFFDVITSEDRKVLSNLITEFRS